MLSVIAVSMGNPPFCGLLKFKNRPLRESVFYGIIATNQIFLMNKGIFGFVVFFFQPFFRLKTEENLKHKEVMLR
jgi:hypothetical protein